MTVSAEEAATIRGCEALSNKVGEVLNFDDINLSLNALADVVAVLLQEADDPETARNQFVAALDATLETLTFLPPELRR